MKLILIHIKKAPGAAVQKKTRKRKSGQKCLDCQRACQKAVPLPHEQQNRQQDHAADQQDLVEDMENSILAAIGSAIAWIFTPLGWGNWKAAVAAITGLVAKENVVGTFGVLYGFGEVAEDGAEIWGSLAGSMTAVAAYSFLVFNLLCAPCFAAMGAIKREMNNAKWFWFAIGYQTLLAYVVSLCVYQIGTLITTGAFGIGTVVALLLIIGFLYLLFRPYKESQNFNVPKSVPGKLKA